MQKLLLPDPWQREAIGGLREGRDVIVDAPTGSGKTLIFEVHAPEVRGRAVYTVPTRALANDKYADWKRRGWEVGILTGDVVIDPGAPIVVATLEAALHRLLAGSIPDLLVIDEFQMLADPVRGGHYEIAVALLPAASRLLLLSGSVANPVEVASWLRRLGRDPLVISHRERPVPLEEVLLDRLNARVPASVEGFWPRAIAAAIAAELSPILIFSPRRREAERLARQLAAAIPCPDPLRLDRADQDRCGQVLARCLERRVAFHHSGLPYPVRAGIVEPLARRGDCRVVVATMGLAAGINFSLRSVLVAGTRYAVGPFEREVRADELLQMFGRAGRRGLDHKGYVLSLTQGLRRLGDAAPVRLRRGPIVPWGALLSAMAAAADRGEDPLAAASKLGGRLFSPSPFSLGLERARACAAVPCGLRVDAERVRFHKKQVIEVLGPDGWGPGGAAVRVSLAEAWVRGSAGWVRGLSTAASVPDGIAGSRVCRLREGPVYGRELVVFARAVGGSWELVKAMRRLAIEAGMERNPTQAPSRQRARGLRNAGGAGQVKPVGSEASGPDPRLEERLAAWLEARSCGARFVGWLERPDQRVARFDYSAVPVDAILDAAGRALVGPEERRVPQPLCNGCPEREVCASGSAAMTPPLAWRTLGLIDAGGHPTRRGRIAALFQSGEGLAIAAALERKTYPVEDLVFDLADLRAGHRFAGEESVHGGRLGIVCAETYGRADHPGYLEMGVPPAYGHGAAAVVRAIVVGGEPASHFVGEELRLGDIERALLEWRSVIRQVAFAPRLDWDRWEALRREARRWVEPRG